MATIMSIFLTSTGAASSTGGLALALGAGTTLLSGAATYGQAKSQSDQIKLQAKGAELEGRLEANVLNENLIKILASNNAMAGAGGLTYSGTLSAIDRKSALNAQVEKENIKLNANLAADALRAKASMAKQSGRMALAGSLLEAGSDVGNYYATRNKVK